MTVMTRSNTSEDTDPLLTIAADRSSTGVVLRAAGEIDVDSAPLLRSAIEEAVDTGAPAIDLDLSLVAFMDSTGLSTIIAARTRLGEGAVRVVAASEPVRRTLDLTGLGALLVER
jgi:anti-anti-sigma factor